MKIITKIKDYYDYLKGIYGEDPLLILDRSKSQVRRFLPIDGNIDTLYIGEYVIQGMWINGVFLTGSDLEPYIYNQKDRNWKNRWFYNLNKRFETENQAQFKVPLNKERNEICWILTKPLYLGDNSPTWEKDCPILLEESGFNKTFTEFPILSDYNMHKVFTPEEIWLILSEWLGRRNTLKEKTVPIGDDKIRIQSHGFDVKTSFRNIK